VTKNPLKESEDVQIPKSHQFMAKKESRKKKAKKKDKDNRSSDSKVPDEEGRKQEKTSVKESSPQEKKNRSRRKDKTKKKDKGSSKKKDKKEKRKRKHSQSKKQEKSIHEEQSSESSDEEESTRRSEGYVDPIIELCNVHKSYPGTMCLEPPTKVLKGVTFEVAPGSLTCIVGKTGSGKTTLGRLLIRSHKQTKGKILYNDKKFWQSGLINDLGYSPEDGLWKYVSAMQHLVFYSSMKGIKEEQISRFSIFIDLNIPIFIIKLLQTC